MEKLKFLEVKELTKLNKVTTSLENSFSKQTAELGKQIIANTSSDEIVKNALEAAIKDQAVELVGAANTHYATLSASIDAVSTSLDNKVMEVNERISKNAEEVGNIYASLKETVVATEQNVVSKIEKTEAALAEKTEAIKKDVEQQLKAELDYVVKVTDASVEKVASITDTCISKTNELSSTVNTLGIQMTKTSEEVASKFSQTNEDINTIVKAVNTNAYVVEDIQKQFS